MKRHVYAALVAAPLLAALSQPIRAEAPGDLPEPKLATADRCVTSDMVRGDLDKVVRTLGGLGAMIEATAAQAFSDEWRRQLGAEPVAVTQVMIWLNDSIMVAEVGGDGCLATMTMISVEAFGRIMDALPDEEPGVSI